MSHEAAAKKSNFLQDFFLGGISGAISKTVSAPLERVKLLLQTQDSNFQLQNKKYTGLMNCFARSYKEEGLLSFWKGNWTNIIRYFPTTAFNFAFKDYFNRTFNRYDAKKEPLWFLFGNVMAGGMAGSCCMAIVYPLDFARTRLGVDIGSKGQKQFNSLTHCITSIVKKDGIKGLYNGIGISLVSIFCYRGMYFGFYDTGKKMIKNYDKQSFLVKFAFAQFVTMASETINYPFDTIRRRMMMNSGLAVPLYANSLSCIKEIAAKEGFKGFYKGNLSNMIRSVSSSLVLVLYDQFQASLAKKL